MIVIIRISGKVKVKEESEQTLFRLGLRKKYTCILIDEKDPVKIGMLKHIRDYVSYGNIEKGVLIRLIEKRGQDKKDSSLGKTSERTQKEIKDGEKIAVELEKGKSLEEQGLKPFFRLHPPRGGLKSSKRYFPKGVLGKNEEINKLIERML